MQTYLMISDGHFSLRWQPAEIEMALRLVAKIFGWNSKITQALAEHYQFQRKNHIIKAILSAAAFGQYDGLISLGDNIHGWTNLGTADESEHEEAKHFRDLLLDKFELKNPPIWVPGNHDIGYYNCSLNPLGTKVPDGENYDNYQKIYGPAYGVRDLNDFFSFLWLSTAHVETAYAASKIKDDTRMEYLVEQEKKELAFLEKQLQNPDRKFLIGIHDPGSYVSPRLQTVLNRYREQICACFTGHIHAKWLMQLGKLVRPSLRQAFSKYNIQFIPSLWGIILPLFFWATGAGYGQLILDGDQAVLENYFIGNPYRRTIKLK